MRAVKKSGQLKIAGEDIIIDSVNGKILVRLEQQAVGKLRVECDLLDFSPCHEVGGDDKIKALV